LVIGHWGLVILIVDKDRPPTTWSRIAARRAVGMNSYHCLAIVPEMGNMGGRQGGVEMFQESVRRRLPDERESLTLRFEVAGNKGFLTVGMYPDKTPGEIFITMSKEGSTMSGLLDSFAVTTSMALQHGVPVEAIVAKLACVKYEPSGMTNHECIKMADSITDFIARYLGMKFVDLDTLERAGVKTQCHNCDKAVWHGNKKYSCIAELPPLPAE